MSRPLFDMRDTVRRYTLAEAERLIALYERTIRDRGADHLTENEGAEYCALLRRLKGRAGP